MPLFVLNMSTAGEAKGLLAATFHPELGLDPRVHERFLTLEPAQMSMQTP